MKQVFFLFFPRSSGLAAQSTQVTPQETAIRVFNLLYPPKTFPVQQGDERDILSYFNSKEVASTSQETFEDG